MTRDMEVDVDVDVDVDVEWDKGQGTRDEGQGILTFFSRLGLPRFRDLGGASYGGFHLPNPLFPGATRLSFAFCVTYV